jgi:hypothetical protein
MQERMPSPPPAEMPPTTAQQPAAMDPGTPPHLADPRALQILTTEHWSLLSQRSLAWTETFARAGMFLATLSAATVALALAGSVMGDEFLVFALVILPVVLFIGLATATRLAQASGDDGLAVQGMNRIRHAYLEMVPELEPYFVTGHYDDVAGIMITAGAPPELAARIGRQTIPAMIGGVLHGFVTTGGMVMIINCVVGAVIAGLVAVALGADTGGAVVAGLAGAIILFVAQAAWGLLSFRTATRRLSFRFPSPPPGA